MKRIPIILICVLFSGAVLLAIRNRPRPEKTILSGGVESRHAPNADKVGWRKALGDIRRPQSSADGVVMAATPMGVGVPIHSGSSAPPAQIEYWPTETNAPLTTGMLSILSLRITNVDMVEQALIEELGPEQGKAIYRRVTELARAHRETNRGVFPGATTNRVLVEFEEEP